MKKMIVTATAMILFSGTGALAREPKATLCRDKALKAAASLLRLNTGAKGPVVVTSTELVDMNHMEGGYEVWDVKMKQNNVDYAPYRMTLVIDDCVITSFSMVGAG